MAQSSLVADLERALHLVEQVNENDLAFTPDPDVSDDVREITGIGAYPTNSHRDNVKARLDAVLRAGNALQPRGASEYVSKLIVACARLAPRSDD